MSFREITMEDVRELLRRHEAGHSARRIARELGVDRKTVGRYLEEARRLEAPANVSDEVAMTVDRADAREGVERQARRSGAARTRAW
jgi:response regulator of citrate/malate metabolism